MGAYARKGGTTAAAEDLERVFQLFPRLRERQQPGGRHAVGRRAADAGDRPGPDGRPRLLLLDEPSMGLAPSSSAQIFEIITEINAQGTTILLVEQNAAQALAARPAGPTSSRAGDREDGAAAQELLDDESVRAAYLGGDLSA